MWMKYDHTHVLVPAWLSWALPQTECCRSLALVRPTPSRVDRPGGSRGLSPPAHPQRTSRSVTDSDRWCQQLVYYHTVYYNFAGDEIKSLLRFRCVHSRLLPLVPVPFPRSPPPLPPDPLRPPRWGGSTHTPQKDLRDITSPPSVPFNLDNLDLSSPLNLPPSRPIGKNSLWLACVVIPILGNWNGGTDYNTVFLNSWDLIPYYNLYPHFNFPILVWLHMQAICVLRIWDP
jgi:hypothetical protein